MTKHKYPPAFLKLLRSVTAKRPKTVINHILKYGHVTTEELQKRYGYEHPPRAARDVREQGIPLETFRVKNSEGRSIAAYRFAVPEKIRQGKLGGRKIFPKKFKNALIENHGSVCAICLEKYDDRYLQIDHRVPYEVSGDLNAQERELSDFMLLCGACNRAKSWSCEHCANWKNEKSLNICQSCYWAFPGEYKHVALIIIRRLDVMWKGKEVQDYEKIKKLAQARNESMPKFVKAVLSRHLKDFG